MNVVICAHPDYPIIRSAIKPESYAKLILRGWALIPKYIPGEMPEGIEIPDDVDIKEFEHMMK